jgi:uncharacterized protein
MKYVRSQADAARQAQEEGKKLDHMQETWLKAWNDSKEGFEPSQERLDEEIRMHHDGYLKLRLFRALDVLSMQTAGMVFWIFWRVLALMLIGMALIKTGFLSARRSLGFYVWTVIIGYLVGLPFVFYSAQQLVKHDFDFVRAFLIDSHYDYIAGVLVSLAHAALVVIFYKKGWLSWLVRRFAAIGRTALSNYLLQTVICVLIFHGYGLGLYGEFSRIQLVPFILGIWILQLIASRIWLNHFRFGPVEWLWRSLTYGKRQPMRLS